MQWLILFVCFLLLISGYYFFVGRDKKLIAIQAQQRADEAAKIAREAYQDYLQSLKK